MAQGECKIDRMNQLGDMIANGADKQRIARAALVAGLIHADDIDVVAAVLVQHVEGLSSGRMTRLAHAINRERRHRAKYGAREGYPGRET